MKKPILYLLVFLITNASCETDDGISGNDRTDAEIKRAITYTGNHEYVGKIEGNTITFELGYGTDLSNFGFLPEIDEYATYEPRNNVDFTNGPVAYTVTAGDGVTTKTYMVSMTVNEDTDNTSLGIYKGVVIGETSGYFEIDLKTMRSEGVLFLAGVNSILKNRTPEGQLGPNEGFSGYELGKVMVLSIQEDGLFPEVQKFNIDGHEDAATAMLKQLAGIPVATYEGFEIERESQDGGANYSEVARWNYNLVLTDVQFALLIESGDDSGLVFREEGTVTKNGNTLTLRSLWANDGGDTPLKEMDEIDQDDSERTFEIDGDQLISRDDPYEDGSVTRQFSYELNEKSFDFDY